MMANEDTIAAISTAMAPSGIGIIRISGPEAMDIADRVFNNPKGKKLAEQKAYTLHYGHVVEDGEFLDEVLAVVMRAPHSYTGEDTVELDCHGGVLATKKVLEAVLRNGARTAEPGEFSKRAFLNGRMDLSQAEAVMKVISAKNEYALKSSVRQLSGSVSEKIKAIRKSLLHETARIEAALDDPEHMSLEGYENQFRSVISEQRNQIAGLLKHADSGILMQEGLKTVIVGKPNAGKSSLLILEEQINIRGITLRILDTAGIRNSDDLIEQIGVKKAMEQVQDADLILCVFDSSVSLDENDRKILSLIRGKKAIILLNKSDLDPVVTASEMKELTEAPVITFSTKNKEGLDLLENTIEKLFFHGQLQFNDEVCITSIRHKQALEEADRQLGYVLKSVDDGMPEDFWSIDLMGACDALGKITGESAGEDLVNEIFKSFCMGK